MKGANCAEGCFKPEMEIVCRFELRDEFGCAFGECRMSIRGWCAFPRLRLCLAKADGCGDAGAFDGVWFKVDYHLLLGEGLTGLVYAARCETDD